VKDLYKELTETFRAHWKLFLVPIILSILVLGAYLFSASSAALAPVIYTTF